MLQNGTFLMIQSLLYLQPNTTAFSNHQIFNRWQAYVRKHSPPIDGIADDPDICRMIFFKHGC